MIQCKDFDLFANGTTAKQYYARAPCNFVGLLKLSSASLGKL